jgi:hypothetical protein
LYPTSSSSESSDTNSFILIFDFIQWKPTDTWPRDRCGRAQLVPFGALS